MDLDSICFLNTPEYSNVMDFAIIVFYSRCCVGLSNAFSEFVNNDINTKLETSLLSFSIPPSEIVSYFGPIT